MIVINKSYNQQRILLTLNETSVDVSGCTLQLFNRSTNVTSNYSMPNDTSSYPVRYNEYLIATSIFSGLTAGEYVYTVSKNDVVIETGMCKVVDEILTSEEQVANTYSFITTTETDDDYVVYIPQ